MLMEPRIERARACGVAGHSGTAARTVMTSLTVLLALLALVVFGGPVIRDFTIAMLWGVVIGVYSTVYVASPMILHLNLRREPLAPTAEAAGE